MSLIQQTQRRRGLPLIEVGPELELELTVWRKAVGHIPDQWLERCYDHAADNWDWSDPRRPFTADALALSYTILLVEDRQRREADLRNAARRDPEAHGCGYCFDLGYQPVFYRAAGAWKRATRPCCCEAAPMSQRNSAPLDEPEYRRSKYGEYVLAADLKLFGAPNRNFENVITSTKEEIDGNPTD